MKQQSPFSPKALLWWIAIIALGTAAALYFTLAEQAAIDVAVNQKRMLFAGIGIVIAGICAIAGTAERWFK